MMLEQGQHHTLVDVSNNLFSNNLFLIICFHLSHSEALNEVCDCTDREFRIPYRGCHSNVNNETGRLISILI